MILYKDLAPQERVQKAQTEQGLPKKFGKTVARVAAFGGWLH